MTREAESLRCQVEAGPRMPRNPLPKYELFVHLESPRKGMKW